ncbi:MAG: YdeI/OmpD-associated family protein [Flavobacteriaceae bacterium]
MNTREELYFKTADDWRNWLSQNYESSNGVYLILYKVSSDKPSMRWEEAVRVALCYGWIDSTVKKLDDERRRQLFTPRNSKSVWSKLNKAHIEELIASKLMHASGLKKIAVAKKDGSWTALDDVESLKIPEDLQAEFDCNPVAFSNYNGFAPSYRKGYLYWLHSGKRKATRDKRIAEIIKLCELNIKTRGTY